MHPIIGARNDPGTGGEVRLLGGVSSVVLPSGGAISGVWLKFASLQRVGSVHHLPISAPLRDKFLPRLDRSADAARLRLHCDPCASTAPRDTIVRENINSVKGMATRRSGVAAQRQLLDKVPVKNGESERRYTGSG